MSSTIIDNDKRTERISELKGVLFRLNDAMHDRYIVLETVQNSIANRILSGQQSMNPKVVENYKLADRILARSLKVNVRIYQRNILYFKMRRRQIETDLKQLGITLHDFDAEWFSTVEKR